MEPEAAILRAEAVSRNFGDRIVLHSLDLLLDHGERLIIRGPNGSGKTTLLRMIAGTLTTSSGRIWIAGAPAGTVAAKAQIGASLTQGRGFYGRLTGHENLLLFARLRMRKTVARAAVSAIEEELGISDIAAVRTDRCSAGMLGQLAIARSLLGEPRLLLLDEPTRSLDRAARERMWIALDNRPETAALVASHLDDDLNHGARTLELGSL